MSNLETGHGGQEGDWEFLNSLGFERYAGNVSFSEARIVGVADTNHAGDRTVYAALMENLLTPMDCVLVESTNIAESSEVFHLQRAGRIDTWEDPALYALVRLLFSTKLLLEEKAKMLTLPTLNNMYEAGRSIENGQDIPLERYTEALRRISAAYKDRAVDARNKILFQHALEALPTVAGKEYIIAGVRHFRLDPKYPDEFDVCGHIAQNSIPFVVLQPNKKLSFRPVDVRAYYNSKRDIDRASFKNQWLGKDNTL